MSAPTDPIAAPLRRILVCGGGLAARMTVAALARQAMAATQIVFVDTGDTADGDLFYGSVAAPSAYAFNLAAGVAEPALVLDSDTAFSWGSRYTDWGRGGASWTQCFALPFPVVDGVLFHHYLAAAGADGIEPFLIAALAAQRGAFAHPPRDPGDARQHPLARADYGYQLDPASYARLFDAAIAATAVEVVRGDLAEVATDARGITGIRLTDGRLLTADLYVDCTGPAAALLARLAPEAITGRRIAIAVSDEATTRPAAPLRTLVPTAYGWRSATPLRGRVLHTTVHDPADADAALAAHDGRTPRTATATLGRRPAAWAGNCVGIGHAAAVVEPVSPAPLMLLERDIERLLSLVPNAGGMGVERREYNRRFGEDYAHAALFDQALLAGHDVPDTLYWQAVRAAPADDRLAHKIAMFERRGLLVAYDLEPFHPEDWTVMHLGIGRRPARHDRLADRAPRAQVERFLADMRDGIARAVAALPDAGAYREQLERYLVRQR